MKPLPGGLRKQGGSCSGMPRVCRGGSGGRARDAAKKSWPELGPWRAHNEPRGAPRENFRWTEAAREGNKASGTRRGSYLHQLSAARRSRNRQTACPKEDIGSDTCVGYPRTLRPRSSAREAGDSVVLCVSGGTVSQST